MLRLFFTTLSMKYHIFDPNWLQTAGNLRDCCGANKAKHLQYLQKLLHFGADSTLFRHIWSKKTAGDRGPSEEPNKGGQHSSEVLSKRYYCGWTQLCGLLHWGLVAHFDWQKRGVPCRCYSQACGEGTLSMSKRAVIGLTRKHCLWVIFGIPAAVNLRTWVNPPNVLLMMVETPEVSTGMRRKRASQSPFYASNLKTFQGCLFCHENTHIRGKKGTQQWGTFMDLQNSSIYENTCQTI